jgi:hypothetical protein
LRHQLAQVGLRLKGFEIRGWRNAKLSMLEGESVLVPNEPIASPKITQALPANSAGCIHGASLVAGFSRSREDE